MNRHQIVRSAHRGASIQYPENTLLAFRHAIEQDLDALELDIHRTADDEVVVIHDSSLERTTNGIGRIRDHTFQEIQQLDAGHCLSYDFHFLTPAIVSECQMTGLALWPWDPDESEDIRHVLRLGAQGIITNRPDMLNKVLNEFTF